MGSSMAAVLQEVQVKSSRSICVMLPTETQKNTLANIQPPQRDFINTFKESSCG